MEISSLNSSRMLTGASEAEKKSEENSAVSIDDFFQLLSAELQNQTMYDSVDSSEYMAQLVQYTMLSQLQEMTGLTNTTYAVSMIGKTVNIIQDDTLVTGTVEGVIFDDGKPLISVDGYTYELSDVLSVE